METTIERCAGIDVHKAIVVACARVTINGTVQEDTRSFATSTAGLLELNDWLNAKGVTHVAMESTGVYWKPVWHILEDSFKLVLANAAHIKNVPGRKSDVQDAVWLAKLMAHGLITPSFVPPTPIQETRDLTRTRKQLVREVGQHLQRIHKVLEDANIKFASVISDLRGKTGRCVLNALISGQTDPEHLATLCGELHASRETIVESLRGRVRNHHRFLIQLHLQQLEAAECAIAEIEQRLTKALRTFREAVELLTTIPGVSEISANSIVAEIGCDMTKFPTAAHLVSWAGLCPRSDESAGKRRSTRLRDGSPWLRTTLVQCAWAAIRSKHSYFKARYLRIRTRQGAKKAAIAVAAAILRAVHAMLRTKTPYHELGADYLDQRNKVARTRRLVRKLQGLGYTVTIQPAA